MATVNEKSMKHYPHKSAGDQPMRIERWLSGSRPSITRGHP